MRGNTSQQGHKKTTKPLILYPVHHVCFFLSWFYCYLFVKHCIFSVGWISIFLYFTNNFFFALYAVYRSDTLVSIALLLVMDFLLSLGLTSNFSHAEAMVRNCQNQIGLFISALLVKQSSPFILIHMETNHNKSHLVTREAD